MFLNLFEVRIVVCCSECCSFLWLILNVFLCVFGIMCWKLGNLFLMSFDMSLIWLNVNLVWVCVMLMVMVLLMFLSRCWSLRIVLCGMMIFWWLNVLFLSFIDENVRWWLLVVMVISWLLLMMSSMLFR